MPLEHAKDAYFVEPEKEGCRRCGQGKTWNVIGPDDLALSTTFEDKDDAEHHASILSEAWRLGYTSGTQGEETPRETLERLVEEDGFDVVLAGLLTIANSADPGHRYRQKMIVTAGVEAIAAVRDAQIAQGYDAAHDDAIEGDGQLGDAAAWLLSWGGKHNVGTAPEWATTLGNKYRYQEGSRPVVLAHAGALIAAEIDRLKRAETKAPAAETVTPQPDTNMPATETPAPAAETVADEVRF
jgi:hypothetical protein